MTAGVTTDPAHRPATAAPWWRRAAVYQVYVRSFRDGDGDGLGDLPGIVERLPYLRDLGVDAVWVTPFYPSGGRDAGYDVIDHRGVDPRFGSLDDAERLIARAHELDLRVIIDVVPNHVSWEHPWFVEALAADPDDPARDRFHFRRGRGEGGEEPPTNWRSFFGGPAWTRVGDGPWWYLHLFDEGQPDLHWQHPDVLGWFDEVLRFWLERGVDGFRVDVAHALAKDPAYSDLPSELVERDPHQLGLEGWADHPYLDRDELHDVVRRWRAVVDEYDDRMMVAEAYVHPDRRGRYVRADEYHQAFNFDFLAVGWDPTALAELVPAVAATTRARGTTATWVLSNHDTVRHATRLGLPPEVHPRTWLLEGPHDALDGPLGLRRARAMALVMLALPGSAYLYQGEELGLPEVWDLPANVLRDPMWRRSGGTVKGRDGCRVPLPWEAGAAHFGFGGEPWLPQPMHFRRFAADTQEGDPGSTLELYRRALDLRARHAVDDELVEMLATKDDVVAFERGSGLRCYVNMGSQPLDLPTGDVLLASGSVEGGFLAPDDAVWLLAGDGRAAGPQVASRL